MTPAEVEEMPWPDVVELMAEFAIRSDEAGESPEARLAREASAKIAERKRRGAAPRR